MVRVRFPWLVASAVACGVLLFLAACGDKKHPAASGNVGDEDAGSLDAASADGAAPATSDGGLIANNPITWRYVGHVPTLVSASVNAGKLTSLASPLASQNDVTVLDLATGMTSAAPTQGTGNVYQEGVFCPIGTMGYFLTGGDPSGLFGDYNNELYTAFDFSARAWADGGALSIVRHHATAASNGTTCAVVGGNSSLHGDLGTNTVFAFSGAPLQQMSLPTLPSAVAFAAAAVVGNQLFVIGGECRTTSCVPADPGPLGIARSDVYSIDESAPSMWTKETSLPHTLQGAVATASSDGRIFVLGGSITSTDQFPAMARFEVLSFTKGDASWRNDGFTPTQATPLFAVANGKSIVALVATADGAAVYSWDR